MEHQTNPLCPFHSVFTTEHFQSDNHGGLVDHNIMYGEWAHMYMYDVCMHMVKFGRL